MKFTTDVCCFDGKHWDSLGAYIIEFRWRIDRRRIIFHHCQQNLMVNSWAGIKAAIPFAWSKYEEIQTLLILDCVDLEWIQYDMDFELLV